MNLIQRDRPRYLISLKVERIAPYKDTCDFLSDIWVQAPELCLSVLAHILQINRS